MERKLASIQRIAKISEIKDADNLILAQVLGWHTVIPKSYNFRENDQVIYFEVDSLLPEKPEFEFLRKSSAIKMEDGSVRFRIRTIKLRGQISQGLILPLLLLKNFNWSVEKNELYNDHNPNERRHLEDGIDISDILDVIKYEPPIPSSFFGKIKGKFPYFVRKTDEIRIQSVPGVLIRNKGVECYITEKVDGQSITCYIKENSFGVCNRTLDFEEDSDNAIWIFARKSGIEKKLRVAKINVAIQGELLGPKIQENKYNLKEHSLLVFNTYNIDTQTYLNFNDFIEFTRKFEFITVPIVTESYYLNDNIDTLVQLSKAKSILNPKIQREGIVIRSKIEHKDVEIGRLSFKVLNPDFLVKFKE